MPVAYYEDFLKQCEAQEVTLHPSFINDIDPIELEARFEYSCHTPSNMLTAIALAGGLLRENPDKQLTDRTIDLGGRLARSNAARALAGIINGSIERLGAESDITDLPSIQDGIDACRAAEYRFAQAFFDLEAGMGQFQIIGDEEPALFRKFGKGEWSALSLRPLSVDGVPYPAGSIFKVDLPRRLYGGDSVSLDEIDGLGFTRLSAYGLGPSERMANFTHVYEGRMDGHVDLIENNMVKSMRIQEIEAMAREAYTPQIVEAAAA